MQWAYRRGAWRDRPPRRHIWKWHMNKCILPFIYTGGRKFSLHSGIPVGTDFDMGRMSKVRRAYHLGRDGQAHDIRSASRAR